MKRSTIVLLVVIALASVFGSVSLAATKSIGKYTQTKYHKIHERIYEWHHCDFNLQATIAGDFTALNPQSHLTIEIDQGFDPVILIDGNISQLGVLQTTKTGSKVSFAKDAHNYSGSLTASSKKLILNLAAKTSRDDFGGNYLLPIDEDIATWNGFSQVARPPFTGTAQLHIVLQNEGEEPLSVTYTLNYKGSNRYSAKTLPWQKITGSLLP